MIILSPENMSRENNKNTRKKIQKRFAWNPLKRNRVTGLGDKEKIYLATFQECLKITLLIGQAFSLIPVNGISSKNPSHVRFKKSSWKCVYAFLSLLGQTYITIMCICKAVYSDPSLKSATSVIFYGSSCITMVMCVQVAKSWPKLVKEVVACEELDPSSDTSLTYRCNIICAIVLSLSLVEHILSLISAFTVASVCYPDMDVYEGFVNHFYPWVFNFLPYSLILGLITQFLHFQSTFIWNFSDLFVICLSYYLTSRLELVNVKLKAAQGKYLSEIFWRSTREEYGRATTLVRKVDNVISGIVFMSFANNLFFICLQLFNTLENGFKGRVQCSVRATGSGPITGYVTAAYFFMSLVYLISRSVAVSLIAAQVNTASTASAPVLYDVPSPVYCVEVQRFLDHITGSKVALTGLEFFSVTRGLLLTVAGTIVTYELVMVQFNAPETAPQLTSANVSIQTNST